MRVDQIGKEKDILDLLRKKGSKVSFSQFGEDHAIWSILKTWKRLEAGFYVDIGAHDPWFCSNTAMLNFLYGWQGINIDASKEAIEKFKTERPKDINICAAVSDVVCEVDYVVFNQTGVNTIDTVMRSKQENAKHGAFKVEEVRKMSSIRLEVILQANLTKNREIDFMNIDVEGHDLQVLKSNNWNRYRPFLIAVEIHDLNMDKLDENETYRYLLDQGYRLVSHCFVTSIFIRNRHEN